MHPATTTAAVIAASTGHQFHIGPWIIVPILILIAIIAAIVYVVKEHRGRASGQPLR